MSTPTLTIAQARVLSELRKPGTKAYYMASHKSWYLSPGGARCTRQIEALKKLNLVKIEMVNRSCHMATARRTEEPDEKS